MLAAALTLGPAAALLGPTPARGQSCDKVDPAEAAFWDSIKNSTSAQDYQAYLDTFPGGCYAALARVRSKAGGAAGAGGSNGAAPAPGPTTRGIDPAATNPPPPVPPKPPAAFDIEPQDRESFITRTANVRDAPSTEANKVETLNAGTGVAITGRVRGTDWYRIARDGRDIGFVFGPLLAEFGGQVAPPVAPPVQTAVYPQPAPYPYAAGPNPLAAEALRKCPAAGGAAPLYQQYDQTAQAFAQQFGPALATMMQAFQGQAAGFLRQFGNRYGVNIEAMMQQALGSLQRDVQAMQASAALRQRIEQQERRDLDALQACARNRAITRQEALAVVQDREATLAQHTQLNAQSRQLVQQRRQDYEQTVPAQQPAASQAPAAQQAQVAQAKAQYDQQAAVTAQANEAALLKQRAQLERSKALLSQA